MAEPTGKTPIPGLHVVELEVHGDRRGWFKENWQRAKMITTGLPDFGPVQNNISSNAERGVTRGMHAEPWDKLISVVHGRVYAAWVDLRPGPSFGATFGMEVGPDRAVFVPRGVANGYQTLEPDTVYSYLVNDHWSADRRAEYSYVNAADPELGLRWPIPLTEAVRSEADLAHPLLRAVTPQPPRPVLILGRDGQVGQALTARLPSAVAIGRAEFDLAESVPQELALNRYAAVINAAAFTAVDAAQTADGRRAAWATNVDGVAGLVRAAGRTPLINFSSDYVFDGRRETAYPEDHPHCPLGVYGQTKAAGEAVVAAAGHGYSLRTSWVIGAGENFVRTMARLADRGVSPQVVDDQVGRLTFAEDLAAGAEHLVNIAATPGVYNLTGAGEPASWAEIAALVFAARGRRATDVRRVSWAEYAAGKDLAPRPANSTLELSKITDTGFVLAKWRDRLGGYLATLPTDLAS